MVLVVGFLMGGPLPPVCLLRRPPNWYREAGWSTTRAPFLNRSRVLEKLDPQKVASATNSNWMTGIMNQPPIPEPSPPRPSFSGFLQPRSTTWVVMIVLVSMVVGSLMRDIVEQILKIVARLAAPQNGKSVSVLSFEAMQRLIEKPAVQKIIYPNNMGKWDDRLMDSSNSFDLSSGEVKQLFELVKLTLAKVVKKLEADPEIAATFLNPKVLADKMDCAEDPFRILKYPTDKELMDAFDKALKLWTSPQWSKFEELML